MIISDLGHLEVVEANVVGAGGYKHEPKKPNNKKYSPKKYYAPKAEAFAGADALALGKQTETATYTSTTAVAGVGSSSSSQSYAKAKG